MGICEMVARQQQHMKEKTLRQTVEGRQRKADLTVLLHDDVFLI